MIKNNRGKNYVKFGFGSPFTRQIHAFKVMSNFPQGSVYQVMPPSSVQEEILKGNTYGNISSAFPNKDTLPPNLSQEGHGQSDHFEVNTYDFTIEEDGKSDSDLKSSANSDTNSSEIQEQISSMSDKKNDAGMSNEEVVPSNEGGDELSESDNLQDINESNESNDQQFLNLLDNSGSDLSDETTERKEIENWFQIL